MGGASVSHLIVDEPAAVSLAERTCPSVSQYVPELSVKDVDRQQLVQVNAGSM